MLREASSHDAAAVIALWEACGLTRPWNDPATDLALAFGSPASTVLIDEAEGALRGSVMAGFDGHRGWVYYLAVAPALQGRGIGRALMKAAEVWLRERGAPKIQLMVRNDNAESLGFYESIGLTRQDVVVFGRLLHDGAVV